jgi:hypothetical protein
MYSSPSTPAPRILIFAANTLISTLIGHANHLDPSRWIKAIKPKIFSPEIKVKHL